mgnify:CR=1 FL=1
MRFDHRRRCRSDTRQISAATSAGIPLVEEDLGPHANNLSALGPPAIRIGLTPQGWPLAWVDRVALHLALYSAQDQKDPQLTLLDEEK